jgi:hypothetical protein
LTSDKLRCGRSRSPPGIGGVPREIGASPGRGGAGASFGRRLRGLRGSENLTDVMGRRTPRELDRLEIGRLGQANR